MTRFSVRTLFISAAMGVALTPDVAVGCSCKARESVRVHTANAKAVFLGEVVHIEPDPEKGKAFFTSERVTFRASEGWKGVSNSDVRVVTCEHEHGNRWKAPNF